MTVREVIAEENIGIPIASPPHVSLFRKLLNILGCIVLLPLYSAVAIHCKWPITLDLVVTIGLAELNRYVNEGRRRAFYANESRPVLKEKVYDEKQMILDVELLQPPAPRLDIMAAVVGWREDPSLFTRALESYKNAKGCAFVLVGIDGDEKDDEDMVDVFHHVSARPPSGKINTNVFGGLSSSVEDNPRS